MVCLCLCADNLVLLMVGFQQRTSLLQWHLFWINLNLIECQIHLQKLKGLKTVTETPKE